MPTYLSYLAKVVFIMRVPHRCGENNKTQRIVTFLCHTTLPYLTIRHLSNVKVTLFGMRDALH